MFAIEFTVSEAGKVEVVRGSEHRSEAKAKKVLRMYVERGKRMGKPVRAKVVAVH